IKWVVLDEADEMLNMGFKDELDFILEHTPNEKQTLLFSATMPKDIARIAKNYMNNPQEISAGQKNIAAANVEHSYFSVHFRDKYKVLKRVADFNPDIYAIVFCRTRRETKEIADRLMADGYNADALHGDLSQAQRDVVMQRFRIKNLQILVATDVAARGIDVTDLTHVINYSLPDATEQYIHRSGRTGRAGKKGVSLAIVSSKERRKIRDIERKIGKEFTLGVIPGGKEICERRLMHTVDKLHAVEVDEEKIAPYLEVVNEKLADLDRDALIKRLLYTEFNRFLSYYSNERDLNQSGGKDRDRGDRGDRGDRRDRPTFARFHINLGEKHDVYPARLIGIINDHTKNNSIKIGEIQIFKKFSFFDVDESFKDEILTSFKDAKVDDFDVAVETVKSPPKSKSRDRGGDRGGRNNRRSGGGGDRRRNDRRRGGRDESFKRGGRKGKKY
ncbi:MAG: DEAD/DEAH box helicase, partial [Saprospiraceae bacterium]